MKIFSVDAETDGLYGVAFAIAVTVRDEGKEIASFQGRCPDSVVKNDWVKQNVLPAILGMPITHQESESLEEAFWEFWMKNKDGCIVIAHCGSPVESGLFRRCVERDEVGRAFHGPYPAIHDIATKLLLKGYSPDSVDNYLKMTGGFDAPSEKRWLSRNTFSNGECGMSVTGDKQHLTKEAAISESMTRINQPYCAKYGDAVSVNVPLSPHHPMYDAVAAAVAWERLS